MPPCHRHRRPSRSSRPRQRRAGPGATAQRHRHTHAPVGSSVARPHSYTHVIPYTHTHEGNLDSIGPEFHIKCTHTQARTSSKTYFLRLQVNFADITVPQTQAPQVEAAAHASGEQDPAPPPKDTGTHMHPWGVSCEATFLYTCNSVHTHA